VYGTVQACVYYINGEIRPVYSRPDFCSKSVLYNYDINLLFARVYFLSDGSGVEVEEQAMIASSRSRPDQPALDRIGMLSDWTVVDRTDHINDHSTDYEDEEIATAEENAFDWNARVEEEPRGEPITEDAIVAGAKVSPRTNLIGDEPFGKLIGPSADSENVIVASETRVVHAAPRTTPSTDPNDVDRAMAAPTRKSLKQGWAGQAARSEEFSWLAAEGSEERRASVDSLVLADDLITAEAAVSVESAPPLPAVSEDVVRPDAKTTSKFDVDFGGLLAEPKAGRVGKPVAVQSQPETDVAEDQIVTTKVSARKFDDFLAQSKIEFTNRTAPDSDEQASLDEVEIGVAEEEIRAAPVEVQFSQPPAEEESVVPQSKQRSAFVIPEFPASVSVSAKVEASPKTKKSGGVLGFFRRRSKNGDKNGSVQSPTIKSNSLDKRTTDKQHEVERTFGSTLPADAKKEKNDRGRFRMGIGFGFGGSRDKSGSPSTENQGGRSPKIQSPRANASGDAAKSPSKTNIRVFEIMAGQKNGADTGLNEQPAPQTVPPAAPEGPPVTAPPATIELTKPSSPSWPPTTSVSTVSPSQPERPPPVIDVHVPTPLPPTVPAFSSQYMVAVAIDFGVLHYSFTKPWGCPKLSLGYSYLFLRSVIKFGLTLWMRNFPYYS